MSSQSTKPLGLLIRIPANSPSGITENETGNVVRVVGSTMAYVRVPSGKSLAFSSEDIDGYVGQPLSTIGVREGAPVRIEIDNSVSSGLTVSLPKRSG